jgi:hypothetical protein
VLGGILNLSFLARCVLFLILLTVNFVSDIYLFLTLFFTEVLMMFIMQLQFNMKIFHYFGKFVSGTSSGSTLDGSGTLTEGG